MQLPDGFPDLGSVLDSHERDKALQRHTVHNHNYWRWMHGGLRLMDEHPHEFDPHSEYWHRTERRLLVAYFAKRFRESFVPAEALRSLAHRTFVAFDRARDDGAFGDPVLADEANWPRIGFRFIEVVERLPEMPEYGRLDAVWRQVRADSFQEDLSSFVEKALENEKPDAVEPSFYLRIAWFPYLGLPSLDDLLDRQRFFFGYYQTFTSTNSYMTGGSMAFAPVLQNNPVEELVAYVTRWAQGETPHETGFVVEGKAERRDRAHHAPVVELYGFLNLHRQPFYNKRSAPAYDLLEEEDDASVFDRLERVGELTRGYLKKHPGVVEELATRFRKMTDESSEDPRLKVEGIRLAALRERYREEVDAQAERVLYAEIAEAARKRAAELSDFEAATALFHIMLDAQLWEQSQAVIDPPPEGEGAEVREDEEVDRDETVVETLPEALRPVANDALGYLKAGYHVLFAGPPGTGKTQLAQFVGHAWNHEHDEVQLRVRRSAFPPTAVGNSAWAPFHTIGGILPDEKGSYVTRKGIFIDPEYTDGEEWRLRPECLVLDEMNRADLDRCIGDLYPLLSQTVSRVEPAGIPGVRWVLHHPRFRLIATVNDASLDDVVFPISEGLARRFLRVELRGATAQHLDSYITGPLEADEERAAAAGQVVEELFELFADQDLIESSLVGEHIPFGVGYFKPLRSWVVGELQLSDEFEQRDLRDQARAIIRLALRSGARVKGLEELLGRLGDSSETV